MKSITDYDITTEGPEYPGYWQGCGTEDYEDVAIGIGNSEREALEDALDQLAQDDWDVSGCAALVAEIDKADDTDEVTALIDAYRFDNEEEPDEYPMMHVSIRVR